MSKGVNVDIKGPVEDCNIGVNELNQTNIKGNYVGGDKINGETIIKIENSKGDISVNPSKSKTSTKEDKYGFVDEILSGHDKSDIQQCKKILGNMKIVKLSDLDLYSEEELIQEELPKLIARKLLKSCKDPKN